MRIALAQLNVVVGDLDGNVERIVAAIREATRASADVVVLPELAVTGYPPEDLLLRPGFVRAAREAVDEVARACTDAVVARRRRRRSTATSRTPPSSAPRARSRASTASTSCRTTGSSTSTGTSPPAGSSLLLELGDALVGPTICEDVWQPGPPATDLALAGATLLVNLSASPFHVGKAEDREEMLVDASARQRGVRRVLQPRRRPGRARLRRPLGRARRRGRGDRARARVRGGAARRRRRPDRGDRPPAARRAPPRARALARPSRRSRRRSGSPRPARAGEPVAARRSRRSRRSSSRCASGSVWACATTCGRTASATS